MRRSSGDLLILSFHYVRPSGAEPFPHLPALDPLLFRRQVLALTRRRIPLSYEALEAALTERRRLAHPALLLTFDDGLIDHHRVVFPFLRANGLTGIFFVSAAGAADKPRVLNVQKAQLLLAKLGADGLRAEVSRALAAQGRAIDAQMPRSGLYRYDTAAPARIKQLLNYELPFECADPLLGELFARHIGAEEDCARRLYLTDAMIRDMAAGGMRFGFHTWNHRVLSRLSSAEQLAELAEGARWLRELTGQQTIPFCYPHGHAHAYTLETVRLVQEAGYSMAFTAVRRFADLDRDDRFELPRFDTRDIQVAGGERVTPLGRSQKRPDGPGALRYRP